MIVKAPSILDDVDVVKALVLLFDFKHIKEKDLSTHLRKGGIHAVVTTGMDGSVNVNLEKWLKIKMFI